MSWSRSALTVALALAVPAAAAAAPAPTDIAAGHYVLDPQHASLIARVQHLHVALATMRFDRFDSSFDYDPAHPEAARIEATVDVTSLDVNGDWAKEFEEDFLSASKFPKATFVSTQIQRGAGGQGEMTGNLTLMGVTRPVTFNVTLIGAGHEILPLPFGRDAAGLEATATIKRSDFGSTHLSGLVGDEVMLLIDAEFARK
jgi:polyisoprenoid-binding protein YceI